MNLTKISIKRPVAVLTCVLALIIFGMSSIISTPVELTPDMEFPMYIISTVYPGAGPQEVEDNVTKVIEGAVSTAGGLKNISSISQENYSIVMLEFEYGTNMDQTYMDVQEKLNGSYNNLPETAMNPTIMELSMNAMPVIMIAAENLGTSNILTYIEDEVVPEFEKLLGVAEVTVSGGQEDYISVELIEERMQQYGLNMSTINSIVGAADFSIPAGDIQMGDQSLIFRGGVTYDSVERLKTIPIPLRTGDIIHLSDVANVSKSIKSTDSISRYNGNDAVGISITKRQSSNTMDVTKAIVKQMEKINQENPSLKLSVVYNSSDMIKSAIGSVVNSLLLGIVISVFVLFFFLGDIKASAIIATSMPLSVFAALVLMSMAGIGLNVMSLGGLVIGVGMMVDNSIVVLESCFRNRDEVRSFKESALEGARVVTGAVIASTATTVVVFLPISLIKGLSGQMFSNVGFTIVFSLLASLISALTLVPLLFMKLEPKERIGTRVSRGVNKLEQAYSKFVRKTFAHKKLTVLIAILLLVISVGMLPFIGTELIPSMDQGSLSVTVQMKKGLTLEKANEITSQVEQLVAQQPDVKDYLLTLTEGGDASISVYLKDDRELETAQLVDLLRQQTQGLQNCYVDVSQSSMMSMGGASEVSVQIQGQDIDVLKEAGEQVKAIMQDYPHIVSVSSNLSDGAPQAELIVDPIKASAVGLTPAQVVANVNSVVTGTKATTLTEDSREYEVRVEYPSGSYDQVRDLSGLMLTAPSGRQVPLLDVATLQYSNAPEAIQRSDRQYIVEISGQTSSNAPKTLSRDISLAVNKMELPEGVSIAMGGDAEMMNEEFMNLFGAMGTAILLVFMVMAIQFESMRFSLVVMISIPFSCIGAFVLLLLGGYTFSMTSLLGFIMLVGIVVNNAIVLIDYANQLRESGMSAEEALVTSGRTRLRPILMTTLTTIMSMLPMALGIGGDVEMMQSMSVVVIGGLTSSTFLTLILIPVFYLIFLPKAQKPKKEKRKKNKKEKSEEEGELSPSVEKSIEELQGI